MLSQKTRVSVIIPTYNEKDTIGELISHIEKYRETFDLSLIIIDDESMDGTREIVSKYCGIYPNLHIIVRRNQRGLGSAILDGFRFALNETPKPEYILTMDADLSHDPSEIPSMVKTCSFGSIVIGSRYTEGGSIEDWSIKRKLISKTANFIVQRLSGIKQHDCTSGYRCYHIEVVRNMIKSLYSTGYEIQIDTLFTASDLGYNIIEYPINFINRRNGSSKMRKSDIINYIYSSMKRKFSK